MWGAWFGLPHVYHADEGFEVYRAVRLGMGQFDFERIAKGGYYLLLFAEYGVYFVVLFVTRAIHGVQDFALRFVEDPSTFWKIGRTTTAVLGTATVFLVWRHGRRLGGPRAGLLAAWFLAIANRHVFESHYISVDVPMTLFTFWAITMIVEDAKGIRRLRTWPFALVAAYAAMNKQPAIVLFVPYFVARWMQGGLRGRGGVLTGAAWKPALLAGAIYVAANPGLFLGFSQLVSEQVHVLAGTTDPAGEYVGAELKTNLWLFYARVLTKSQGQALLALSVLGAGLGLLRRERAVLLHLSFLVPFFILIAASQSSYLYYPRYTTPLIPGLCLLAGLGLDEIVRRLRAAPRAGTVVALGTALLVSVQPVVGAARWDAQLTRKDTRTMAVEWIEAHVPHKTRILMEGFPEDAAQLSIPLRDLKRNVRRMVARLEKSDPGKARYWSLKVDTLKKPLYDLVTVRHYEPYESLADYVAQGVEYVVIRREYFVPGGRLGARLPSEAAASRYAFYEELLNSPAAQRVAAFESSADGNPGYDIEIWQVAPHVEQPDDAEDE